MTESTHVSDQPLSESVPPVHASPTLRTDDKDSLRLNFGRTLRHRREEKRLTQAEVARHLGWSAVFYGDIEKGRRSSDDVLKWVRLAELLDLGHARLLEQVWETREGFTLGLPPAGDDRRKRLVELAIELYAADEVETP